jgi:hypothetical protein
MRRPNQVTEMICPVVLLNLVMLLYLRDVEGISLQQYQLVRFVR